MLRPYACLHHGLPYLWKRSSPAMGPMIASGACTSSEECNEGGV